MNDSLDGIPISKGYTDAEKRIYNLQRDGQIWIDFPKATSIIETVQQFCKLPVRAQAPCLIVCGEGGTGKSSIIRQLRNDKNICDSSIFLAMNENPYNLKFNDILADALGVPNILASRRRAGLIKPELLEVIRLRKLRCLIIDELQDGFFCPRTEQLKLLSRLKGLSNEPWGLSISAFGTSLASSALSIDKQMSRRFQRIDLEDWKESEAFRSFLAGLEIQLELKHESHLDSEEIVTYLMSCTLGRMDDVVKLIRAAACYAIATGEERLTVDLLKQAQSAPWLYSRFL